MSLSSKSIKPVGGTYEVEAHVYVAADGRTVVPEGDKRSAFLRYSAGTRITEEQRGKLIWPSVDVAETLSDAEQRTAPVADADKRSGRGRK